MMNIAKKPHHICISYTNDITETCWRLV